MQGRQQQRSISILTQKPEAPACDVLVGFSCLSALTRSRLLLADLSRIDLLSAVAAGFLRVVR